MEKRLKQQRNRLFLRVTLILSAVFIAVSLAYSFVCLYNEKIKIQNRATENLAYTETQMAKEIPNFTDYMYYIVNLLYFESNEEAKSQNMEYLISYEITQSDPKSQIVVTDQKRHEVVINTASKTAVKYGLKINAETSPTCYGLIDYNVIRSSLTDEQYKKISELLSSQRSDGKSYELICTKFQIYYSDFIPTEIQIALVDPTKSWFMYDEIIETMRRNIIPKDFFIDKVYGQDYIGSMTKEQKKKTSQVISTGLFEYIFYTTGYIHFESSSEVFTYTIQYAQKVNLMNKCKVKLAVGILVIFVFFLTITFILCLMVWKLAKIQVLQEQKRSDITNALAHDIKTPLFVISGYAYSLKENIDAGERDKYLDKIIEQTDTINDLVHKMLNLSKLDSYNVNLNCTDFDLFDLVNSIKENIVFLPDNKKISITHIGDNTVNADKDLIKTAIQNLMDNAVLYSLLNSEITIDISDKILTITNQSEHLTKSELKQIWQPYVRKDKSRHQKGNGLGLSIVKSIFDLHSIKYGMSMENEFLVCKIEF